ncbi:MAG: hypothetical protein HQL51_10980 [Magnetococcales bacterium]|nr:hypothetical protein [Magnetococcales bacterium]
METLGKKYIAIPVVEAASRRVAGGFCSTQDAVSADELAALQEIRRIRDEIGRIKTRLDAPPDAQDATESHREALREQLEALRDEGKMWSLIREEANRAKHRALGHVTLPLDDPGMFQHH